jgi:molecular chaperone DnaK
MMKDAETHAQDDRSRKDEADIRNQGESLVYQTKKFISDNEASFTSEKSKSLLTDLSAAIILLEQSLNGANFAEIKENTEKVTALSQALGAALYENKVEENNQSAAGDAPLDSDEGTEPIEDAEIVEEK